MIKPVYTIPETAPMKFYRFLMKFGLPIGILINIVNLITHFGNHDLHWLDGVIMVAHIVLLFFSIDGLRRMEWSGVRFLYATILLSLGYSLFFLLIYLVLSPRSALRSHQWDNQQFHYLPHILGLLFQAAVVVFCGPLSQ